MGVIKIDPTIDPKRNLPTWNAINTQLGQEHLNEDPATKRKTHILATLTVHIYSNRKVKSRMLKYFIHRKVTNMQYSSVTYEKNTKTNCKGHNYIN